MALTDVITGRDGCQNSLNLFVKVQIDDLERPETAENMSTVNRDTRLDNRILDLRTATKQVCCAGLTLQGSITHSSQFNSTLKYKDFFLFFNLLKKIYLNLFSN